MPAPLPAPATQRMLAPTRASGVGLAGAHGRSPQCALLGSTSTHTPATHFCAGSHPCLRRGACWSARQRTTSWHGSYSRRQSRCVHHCACVSACVCASVHACMCACVYACACACVIACIGVCDCATAYYIYTANKKGPIRPSKCL